MVIAMDGVAASGKSSLGKKLSDTIDFAFLDTGTLYRLITCRFYEYFKTVVFEDIVSMSKDNFIIDDFIHLGLKDFNVEFIKKDGEIHLFSFGGIDYTPRLHEAHISKYVTYLSSIPRIRSIVREIQHDLGRKGNIVVAGRDIGSFVFPDAEVKFFITIDPLVRAERRLTQSGTLLNKESLDKMICDLRERDLADENRDAGAMKVPEDAIIIDNSMDGIELVLNTLLDFVIPQIQKLPVLVKAS